MATKARDIRREADRRAGRDPDKGLEQVATFLASDEWTEAEKWVMKWQFRLLGDFRNALFHAIACADDRNIELLALGFPDEVAGYKAWTCGDLAKRLRDAGLQI